MLLGAELQITNMFGNTYPFIFIKFLYDMCDSIKLPINSNNDIW
mgnify:CR=1 FL=1